MTDLSWRDDDVATWGDDWNLSPDQVPAISQLRRRKRRRGLPPDQVPKKQAEYPETAVSRHRRNYRLKDGGLYLARGKSRRAAPPKIPVHESKKPGYTKDDPSAKAADTPTSLGMRDKKHDLNELAKRLGLTFEEASAKLTAPGRNVSSDPLSRARRIVRGYQRTRAKDPDFKPSSEVLAAFKIINESNYPAVKARRAAKKLAM
jgi:hypothetical protein